MTRIILTNVEMMVASQVGTMRRIASMQRDLTGKDINSHQNYWDIDVNGAAAEMAVAKHLGVYWIPSVNTGKSPDVGPYQVRSTPHKNGKLIIRENDKKEEQYILVVANPPFFFIKGWKWSNHAKTDEFWKPADETGIGAWWVPQDRLEPMETLYD